MVGARSFSTCLLPLAVDLALGCTSCCSGAGTAFGKVCCAGPDPVSFATGSGAAWGGVSGLSAPGGVACFAGKAAGAWAASAGVVGAVPAEPRFPVELGSPLRGTAAATGSAGGCGAGGRGAKFSAADAAVDCGCSVAGSLGASPAAAATAASSAAGSGGTAVACAAGAGVAGAESSAGGVSVCSACC